MGVEAYKNNNDNNNNKTQLISSLPNYKWKIVSEKPDSPSLTDEIHVILPRTDMHIKVVGFTVTQKL